MRSASPLVWTVHAWGRGVLPWWRRQARSAQASLIASALLAIMLLLDGPLLALGRSLDPSARALLRRVTLIGDSSWSLIASLVIIALAVLFARRSGKRRRVRLRIMRRAATYVLASVAVSGFLASLTKHMIGRARPSALDPSEVLAFKPMLFRASYASFPSGHATTAIALAVALGFLWPRHRLTFLIIGIWGALSRALLGVHWLSDILAGAVLGMVVAVWLRDRMWRDRWQHVNLLGPDDLSFPQRRAGKFISSIRHLDPRLGRFRPR